MVEHTCELCNKTFDQKAHYLAHIQRKNPCIKPIDKKTYAELQTTCAKFDEIVEKLKNEIEELKNKSDKSIKKIENANTKLTKINKTLTDKNKEHLKDIKNLKTINTKLEKQNAKICKISDSDDSNMFDINAFGNETVDMDNLVLAKNILQCESCPLEGYVKYIHFNKDFPENHNIYLTNIKSDHVSVHNGDTWLLNFTDKVINKLIVTGIKYIRTQHAKLNLNPFNEADIIIVQTTEFLESCDAKDDEYKSLNKKMKLLLYNSRSIVKATKDSMKNVN